MDVFDVTGIFGVILIVLAIITLIVAIVRKKKELMIPILIFLIVGAAVLSGLWYYLSAGVEILK